MILVNSPLLWICARSTTVRLTTKGYPLPSARLWWFHTLNLWSLLRHESWCSKMRRVSVLGDSSEVGQVLVRKSSLPLRGRRDLKLRGMCLQAHVICQSVMSVVLEHVVRHIQLIGFPSLFDRLNGGDAQGVQLPRGYRRTGCVLYRASILVTMARESFKSRNPCVLPTAKDVSASVRYCSASVVG